MSLIELMISLTIGLIITLAIATIFLTTKRSNKENTETTAMQENARFAMESLAEDIRHAGFFGNVADAGDVQLNGITLAAANDCHSTAAGAPYVLDFATRWKLINYSADKTDAEITAILAPCTTADTLPADHNSLLFIKRVATNSTTYAAPNTQPGHLYVHSIGSNYSLGVGAAMPIPDPKVMIWEYTPRIYYITNKGTLYRKSYNGGWTDEPLAEGIEQFRVEFGIDTTSPGDGIPDYFIDPPATDDVLNNAVSARVYVLARTANADPNYMDSNSYTLGSYSYGTTANPIPADKLNYHRQVYSTTVTIANLRGRVLLH